MTDGSKSQEQDQPSGLPPLPGAAQPSAAPFEVSVPEVVAQKSVLQKIEQRGRPRRRKPPAWATKVANSVIATKQFLREKLPNSILRRRRELMTAAVSFLIHLGGALLLTLFLLPHESRDSMFAIISGRVDEELADPLEVVEIVQPEKLTDLDLDSTMKQMVAELDKGTNRDQFDSPQDTELRIPLDKIMELGDIAVLKGDFGGRSDAGRRAAVKKYGGTAESEKSVNLGLTWLQKIQRADGSWSFGEVGEAGSPGSMQTTDVGATALAPADVGKKDAAQDSDLSKEDSDSVSLIVVNGSPTAAQVVPAGIEVLAVNAVSTTSLAKLEVAVDELVLGSVTKLEYRVARETKTETAEVVAGSRPERVISLSDAVLEQIQKSQPASGVKSAVLGVADTKGDPAHNPAASATVNGVARREFNF
ncbi:MAG: hypothetical protein WCO86_01510 [Planctomycetota bacterium]